jgi:serine/threonine protein kinase
MSAKRNLLLGILALQNNFIDRGQLLAAFNAWVEEKGQPLGELLVAQRALRAEQLALLDALTAEHLRQHDGDPDRSLAALGSISPAPHELAQIADHDVQASLATVAPATLRAGDDPDGTAAWSDAAEHGRFRVLRPHAAGGLGVVSVARDEQLNREVALKEIKEQHAHNADARARFLLEAEITGALEHPGIVPVYSLGSYADGRPFYAMRFIKGDSLKEAIDQFHGARPRVERRKSRGSPGPDFASLAFRKLLGRFIDVCNAVAYAHSRGVLHRDLKPGNIMLGKYGETLVVDWGLAKAGVGRGKAATSQPGAVPREWLVRPPSGSGSTETLPGAALGTPAFMSPEQAAGKLDLLGPASDVYSLGATLYALLTGRPPFGDASVELVLANVQLGDFHRPRQLQPGVPPALEAVCLKAMALRPADRYGTPLELVQELEHWLADEPVRAYGEPWSVRARRLARKHRTLVASAAAGLLVATFGALVAAVLLAGMNRQLDERNQALDTANANLQAANEKLELAYQDAQQKRQQAEEQRQIAQSVRLFLQHDLLRQADPVAQANRLLVLGSDHFTTSEDPTVKELLDRTAAELTPEKIDEKFPHQPLVQAEILQAVGLTYHAVGAFAKAVAHLERARALYQTQLGTDHSDALVSADLLAMAYQSAGKLDQAVPLHEETLTRLKATLGLDHPHTAIAMNNLALGYRSAGKLDLAASLHEQVVELMKARRGPDHPETLLCTQNLAADYRALAKYDRALPLFAETLQRRRAVLGPHHPDTLHTMNSLAVAYAAAGKLDRALPLYEEALKGMKAKLGVDHPDTLTTMSNLGVQYRVTGNLGRAVALQEEALERRKVKLGADHLSTVMSMDNLGLAYQDAGKIEQALELFQEAFKRFSARLGPDHPDTLTSMNNLAMGYLRTGKLDRALPLLDEALKRHRATLGPEHPGTLTSINNLASACWRARQLDRSIPLFEELLPILKRTLGDDHPYTVTTLANLGVNYRDAGRLAEAVTLLEQAHHKGRRKPGMQWVGAALVDVYVRAGRKPEAGALIVEHVKEARASLAAHSPQLAATLAADALVLLKVQDFPQAEKLLRECLDIRQKAEPDVWTTFNTQSMLGAALVGRKQYAEAEPLLVTGYEGMKKRAAKIPPQGAARLTEAEGRLADLFEATRAKQETRLQGRLTDTQPESTHEVTLAAGKPLVVEMHSKQFSTQLRLEDANGILLAARDSGAGANKDPVSRIVLLAPAGSAYRVVAASMRDGRGEYELVIRQYAARPR